MMEKNKTTENKGIDLKEFFGLLCDSRNWKTSFEHLILKARKDLIFDNLVIYQTDFETGSLEVVYAKSTGRGRSAEADASWGDMLASRVLEENKLICEEPQQNNMENRLDSAYLLGIPLLAVENLPGVLVFIRFGGPSFCDEDLSHAHTLAGFTTLLLRQKILHETTAKIREIQASSQLQSDFINTISHELRSPLGFIKGYATTLLRTDTKWDQETQNEFLGIIERETNNLTDLIDDLLDSSRLQSGQMKFEFNPLRLDSLIRDEVTRIRLTNPTLKVELDFEGNIPAICGDARKLAQVFDNLLSNAVKYAPDTLIKISLSRQNDLLKIDFSDEGPGIPEVYLPRIFSRFFRVPEQSMKAHGSGLGLYICKQIIEKHEGTLSVSTSSSGTTFTIGLPINLAGMPGIKIKEIENGG